MDLSQFLEELIRDFGYIGVAVGLYIEHVFPPAPMQLVIPFAAVLVVSGDLNFVLVWITGTLGAMLGSWTLYEFGRWANEPLVRRFIQRYGRYLTITESDLDSALQKLERYGNSMVFVSHMIPLSIVRVVVSIFAGVQKIPRMRFLLYTGLGTLLWIGLELYAVVLIGGNWNEIVRIIQPYEPYLWGVGFVIGGLCVVWYIQRLRRHPAGQQ